MSWKYCVTASNAWKYEVAASNAWKYEVAEGDNEAAFSEAYAVVYDAMQIKPSADISAAQDTMLTKIYSRGVWSKLDFFHLEGGHVDDNGESKINWIAPGTNDMYVAAGSPDFEAHSGFKGDGVVDVMKNGLLLDGSGKYKQDNASLGVYIQENISETKSDIGANSSNDSYLMTRTDTTSMRARLNDQTNHYTPTSLSNQDGRGMWIVTRTQEADKKIYKNGVRVQYAQTPTTGTPDGECAFLSDGVYKSTRRQGCVFGGEGLNEGDVKTISDAVAEYFATVGGWSYDSVDVVIIGDKTLAYDDENADDVDFSLLFNHPKHIIGVGDFASETKTQDDLLYLYRGYSQLEKFWSCVGNHDIYTDPSEFLSFFNLTKTYYSKVIGSVEYFFFDTLLKMDESGRYTMAEAQALSVSEVKASTQGQWLINALAASQASWKVLVYHIPTWCSNYNLNTSPQMEWDWAGYGVDLILNGHMHFYERLLVNTGSGNVPVIITGTSGANQLTIGDPHEDSIIRINDASDADFAAGMFLTMEESSTQLSLNLHAVDESRNIVADKDTLTLNK